MHNRLIYILDSIGNDAEVSRKLEVSPATVSMWRSGERLPRPSTQRHVCEKLGFSVEWLRSGEGNPRPGVIPPDMEKLEAIMSGKSEVKKNFIRALADMPEALLDEMLPYLRKAVAELDRR